MGDMLLVKCCLFEDYEMKNPVTVGIGCEALCRH